MQNFVKVAGKDIGDIKIFTLSTCGWCKKTKNFLADQHITFSYIDVDLLPKENVSEVTAELMKFNPDRSFPTIIINDRDVIIGFDRDKLGQLVGENQDG
jgi:glutaredoxin